MVKKIKKKEELPSFLLKVTSRPKELESFPEEVPNDQYLGPVFFGGCHQYHHNPHSLNLRSFHHTQFNDDEAENILKSILLPKSPTPKKSFHVKPFRPRVRKRKEFVDHYSHRCPGQKKVFVPEVVPPVVDFGETTSIIYGETSREIPMYRLKGICSRTSQVFEIVTLSDIRERKRMLMSPQERAVHPHFLKEFATVRVIGPPIPAAITITKIPSKRKRLSDVSISSKIRKTVEDESRRDDTIQKEEEKVTTPAADTAIEKVDENATAAILEEEGKHEEQEIDEAEEEDSFEQDNQIIGEEDEQTIEEPFSGDEEREDTEGEEIEEEPEESEE